MGFLDDMTAGISSFEYLTETIIVVAALVVAIVAILLYRRSLRKKTRHSNEPDYGQPGYGGAYQATGPWNPQTPPQQDAWGYQAPPQQNAYGYQAPAGQYPGSIIVVGNYTLFDDRIQVSPRKCVFYDEITSVRYESNYNNRVVVTIGHAWELSLSAGDQTLKLYNGIMTKMNSELIMQSMGRKKRMLR